VNIEEAKKTISGQSRKIHELLIENKRLRMAIRDLGHELKSYDKEIGWAYEAVKSGHALEDIKRAWSSALSCEK